jgi:hypothetical protein
MKTNEEKEDILKNFQPIIQDIYIMKTLIILIKPIFIVEFNFKLNKRIISKVK